MAAQTPQWMDALSDEDRQFLKRFLLASGSLKALAKDYGISYPTVRNRLDKLIEKVKVASEAEPADPFHRAIRVMVAEGRLGAATAKELLETHRRVLEASHEEQCCNEED